MPQPLIVRTTTAGNAACADVLRQYSQMAGTVEVIRLAITKRYIDPSELPSANHKWLHNTPLLLAAVVLNLPGVDQQLVVVVDYPGLTMQRDVRETEARDLVNYLATKSLVPVNYGVQPIAPTEDEPADRAATMLLACDFTALTAESSADLLRRLKG